MNEWTDEYVDASILLAASECVWRKRVMSKKNDVKCMLFKTGIHMIVLKRSNLFTYSNEDSMFSALAWPSPLPPLPPSTHTIYRCFCIVEHTCSYDKMRCTFTLNGNEDMRRGESRRKRDEEREEELRTGIASFEYFSNLCPHTLSLKDAYVRIFFSALLYSVAFAIICCCYLCFLFGF